MSVNRALYIELIGFYMQKLGLSDQKYIYSNMLNFICLMSIPISYQPHSQKESNTH